jgi:hypothetical protein
LTEQSSTFIVHVTNGKGRIEMNKAERQLIEDREQGRRRGRRDAAPRPTSSGARLIHEAA